MAIIMPKQTTPAAEDGYIKLFLNSLGHLSSIDESGYIRTYAEGDRLETINFTDTGDYRHLTSEEYLLKSISLAHSPIPETVIFKIAGCLDQPGFYVEENFIKWDNMGLDGFLDMTDLFQISYSYYS